jgi:glucose/arabinose dehydrogenase
VVVVMLICSAVYAYWQRPRHVTSAQQPAATAPAAVPQQAAPQPSPPAAENPPAAPASTQTPAPTAVATQAAAAAPAPSPVPAAAAPRGAVHVELASNGEVWVRAQADGKVLFATTMEPNQSRTIDAESTVVLRLGNAGAVTITLNGKQLDPVGPVGQVRTVQLTSGGFQIVAPPKAPDALDPL